MSIKYCSNCDRIIRAKRVIGIGTFVLCLLTSGVWFFIIILYRKRCPICMGRTSRAIWDFHTVL